MISPTFQAIDPLWLLRLVVAGYYLVRYQRRDGTVVVIAMGSS